MQQKIWMKSGKISLWITMVSIALVLLTACGGSTTTTASKSAAVNSGSSGGIKSASNSPYTGNTGNQQQQPNGQQQDKNSVVTPQYLIKTLKVSLVVKDTRQVSDEIQNWITAADARATSAGTQYQQIGDNQYSVSVSYSVPATSYPQVYRYLREYTTQKGGRLSGFNETVQDITNDYVDTDSRLKNLRTEQTRLQDLLSHAQALSDVLSIEQRLTDVEGQIESYEAHIKSLADQVAFYTISIDLEPSDAPVAISPNSGWSAGQSFHDAFTASLAFGQGFMTFIIWLLAFAIYIVPVVLLIWFIRKLRKRQPMPILAASVPVAVPVNSDDSLTTSHRG